MSDDVGPSCPFGEVVAIVKRGGAKPQTYLIAKMDGDEELTGIIASAKKIENVEIGNRYGLCTSFNRFRGQTKHNGKNVIIKRLLDRSPVPISEPELLH